MRSRLIIHWADLRLALYVVALIFLTSHCTHDPGDPPPPPQPIPKEPVWIVPEEPKTPWDYELGSYSTEYKSGSELEGRAFNIAHTARKLTGTVLAPGESFSFNTTVGPRSLENGYLEAPVIYLGVLEPGVGGGVCQVSSTLNAAVLKAGLKPTQRTAHSRPSGYIMKGLDATVSWPECAEEKDCYKLDYRFTNTYSFPIGIKAEVEPLGVDVDSIDEEAQDYKYSFNKLTFTIYGQETNDTEVEFRSSFKWGDPFQVRYRRTNRYRNDYHKRIQEGKRGRTAVLRVTTKTSGQEPSTTYYKSDYRPVDEVWEVGLAYEVPNGIVLSQQ